MLRSVRVGVWQNGFFADFYFWAAGFFRGFCRRIFSPHFCGENQLRPEGRNRRGETPGPEVLGPLRGLGIRPLVSVIRGLGNPFPEAP